MSTEVLLTLRKATPNRGLPFASIQRCIWCFKENIAVDADVEAVADRDLNGRLHVQVASSDLGANLRHLAPDGTRGDFPGRRVCEESAIVGLGQVRGGR